MDTIDGAVEALTNWSNKGYDIAIVTGRLTNTYDSSLEWLSKHQVPYDSFTIVDKYQRPDMDPRIAISKEQLSAMEFSLAVEDSAEMAVYLSNDMNTQVALLDRPWNRGTRFNGNVNRYTAWVDLQDGVVFV